MKRGVIITLLLVLIFTSFIPVFAQIQDFNFSGNDPASYQCFDTNGNATPIVDGDGNGSDDSIKKDDTSGVFYCDANGNNRFDSSEARAVLKPPQLQQLEIWFVKIIYTIWALVASFSFLLIVWLGYQYLISRGDPTQIKAIRERIIRFIIGFVLVFLAVPILTTIFRLLGVNDSVKCYQGLTSENNVGIGFQFFYTDLCTDPAGLSTNPCDISDLVNDIRNGGSGGRYACPLPGEFKGCSAIGSFIGFCCDPNEQVWRASTRASCR